jgi:hypothetical protein
MAVDAPTVAKNSPYFSNQYKFILASLFQNVPSAPGIAYDTMSRLITFGWAQVRLRQWQMPWRSMPPLWQKFPLFFKPMKR